MKDTAAPKRVKRGTAAPRPTIVVDQDTIEQAKQRDSGHCMIAEAIKASVPGAASVSVDLASIRWTDRARGLRFIYLTPRVAQMALLRFDQGDEAIEPFQFALRGATVIRANTKVKAESVPTRARIKPPKPSAKREGVPDRVGGQAPPLGPLSNNPKVQVGRRREYGLRALNR